MYHPQTNDLDFEMGAFGDNLKKGLKKVGKVVTKVTDATIVKPSAAIGKAIGGKKGEAIGKKLGKLTATVTKVGLGAGAAGAVAPVIAAHPTLAIGAAAGIAGKKIKDKKKAAKAKRSASASSEKSVGFKARTRLGARLSGSKKPKKTDCSNALASQVGARLVAKLGKPLSEANKMLKLAELQREATFEHKKLMSDADFRKKVLAGIAVRAGAGDSACQKTIRVLIGR